MKNTYLPFVVVCAVLLVSFTGANTSSAAENTSSCEQTFQLPDNQWRQISLPCDPGTQASLANVLGDDIAAAFSGGVQQSYGNNWIVYQFDAASGYIELDETGNLAPGVGYWIIQQSGNSAILDLPVSAAPAATIRSPACTSADGCFEIPLATSGSGNAWSMTGHPFTTAVNFGSTGIRSTSGICTAGCNPDTPAARTLFHNELWNYNGTGYTSVSTHHDLNPWAGYWAATLPAAHAVRLVSLLIPKAPSGSISAASAARFLTQATFGPTQASIQELRDTGDLETWIDNQMALPIDSTSLTLPYVRSNADNRSDYTARHRIWWENVMHGDAQLRQRVAFALSEIFVISDIDYVLQNSQYGVSSYYDMLVGHAFGNYRELLEDVTLHAAMGTYLGMVRNQKANPAENIRPDENYAREVLQLFSVGLHKLTPGAVALPEATYTQDTVENFARVFTGWNFADLPGDWLYNYTEADRTLQMRADYVTPLPTGSYHDTGTKTLLGGVQLVGNSSRTATEDDMQFALDNIANHPNTGPFISKLLIQRLTTSNPSPAYVARVASKFNDNGSGVRGDLGAVIKAILLDNEARMGKSVNPEFGKIKEPLLMLSQLWRAFDAVPGTAETNSSYRTNDGALYQLDGILGQAVLKSPSVFNFFLPDNPLSGESTLLSPEVQIMSGANLASAHNLFYTQVYYFNNQSTDERNVPTRINIDDAVQLASQPDTLLDYLNVLMLAGSMNSETRSTLSRHISLLPNDESGLQQRAKDAIFLIAASPAFQVQQ